MTPLRPKTSSATSLPAEEVPSLATVWPYLPGAVQEWVQSVLRGETTEEYATRRGINKSSYQYYSRVVAEWAGLAPGTSVREAILRMFIRQLRESNGREG